ncbi:hypothetical protein BMS3Bbin06_01120 [bacterium BMS3Bbin06]|nr:hypothetical protein BMS3Abin08_00978 [bacterium BMS3Abin08]GBE34593.1 hypothetical protein BMS3Bbin06_01120 [bacterium BMS3Bbin06]
MMESSVILSGHSARFRGNFAIHLPGESDAKFKTLQLQSCCSFLPVFTMHLAESPDLWSESLTFISHSRNPERIRVSGILLKERFPERFRGMTLCVVVNVKLNFKPVFN